MILSMGMLPLFKNEIKINSNSSNLRVTTLETIKPSNRAFKFEFGIEFVDFRILLVIFFIFKKLFRIEVIEYVCYSPDIRLKRNIPNRFNDVFCS